jgi:hypothetical protein
MVDRIMCESNYTSQRRVATLSSPQVKNQDSCGMTQQTVACLDLAKTFSGTTLYALEHFRYGCPGAKLKQG